LLNSMKARAGRLTRAIAVLNRPLRANQLRVPEDAASAEAHSIEEWPEAEVLTVALPRGRVLRTAARALALSTATEKELTMAHHDAAIMLSHPEVALTLEVREQLLTHLLGAGRYDDALLEANELLMHFRLENRARSARDTLDELDEACP